MYMHLEGYGDAAHLAAAIHDALSLTKTPTAAPPSNPAQSETANLQFDSKLVESVLGHAGKNNNGIYQFSIHEPRRSPRKEWLCRTRWA